MLETKRGLLSVAPMSFIAILGYGRFGSALGTLLREGGVRVRALDPDADIPEEDRARSAADLVRGASLIAVAVPVPNMGEAFAMLRPHVTPDQIVFDVGSVKIAPSAMMAATFGSSIPWVATHPLFGPVSLACGERPLRTVICRNALHPHAVERVASLFRSIGCVVHEETADAHDRLMAFTHALAFFVAKGMLDAGAPVHLAYAPPSFQGLTRTIEAVRGDAGHLFVALHRENPYAGDARHALLRALSAIDRGLDDPTNNAAASAALAIPDLGAHSPDLRETRELIDELDHELLALFPPRAPFEACGRSQGGAGRCRSRSAARGGVTRGPPPRSRAAWA